MTYTIKLDLFIDDDEIYTEEMIQMFLKNTVSSASVDVYDCKILDVED